jgi:hypothetical protein
MNLGSASPSHDLVAAAGVQIRLDRDTKDAREIWLAWRAGKERSESATRTEDRTGGSTVVEGSRSRGEDGTNSPVPCISYCSCNIPSTS